MKKALIVLDAQRIYTDKDSELFCRNAEKTLENINKLIQLTSKNGELVILVRHIHKIDGSDIGRLFDFEGEAEDDFNFKEGSNEVEYDNNLIRPKNAIELKKTRYSAFQMTNLDEILKNHGIRRVVICGFMTNFCCESTAREALDRDYYVDFAIDATGSPGTDNLSQKRIREVVSELLSSGFARVMTAKQIMSHWENS